MAKKVVASYKSGKENKTFVKVIRMVKSPKTNAYTFKEEMVGSDYLKEYLQNKVNN
ncbi:MAG: DUF4295 domain-containing protein [Bacteroidales bacterium]|nr:DUF4295 domain-containing protein [Bacteroidales bacterium]